MPDICKRYMHDYELVWSQGELSLREEMEKTDPTQETLESKCTHTFHHPNQAAPVLGEQQLSLQCFLRRGATPVSGVHLC